MRHTVCDSTNGNTVFGGMFVFYDCVLVYSCHFSIARAAVLVDMIPLLSIPAARNVHKMHELYSSTFTLLIGSVALLAAVLLSSIVAARGFAPAAWIATVLLSSIGIGLCFPTLSIEAVKGSPSSFFALMGGLNQSFRLYRDRNGSSNYWHNFRSDRAAHYRLVIRIHLCGYYGDLSYNRVDRRRTRSSQ